MYCSADFAFSAPLSWLEMLDRLRRIGAWDEGWSVDLGDTLISIDTTTYFPRRLEKLTIYFDQPSERWILDTHFDCEGSDASERWPVFAWRIMDTLTVVDAYAIEKLTASSSEGVAAWIPFDYRMGFVG